MRTNPASSGGKRPRILLKKWEVWESYSPSRGSLLERKGCLTHGACFPMACIPNFSSVIFYFRGEKPGNYISQNPLESTNKRTDLTRKGQKPSRCYYYLTKGNEGVTGNSSTPVVPLRIVPMVTQQLGSLVTVSHTCWRFRFPENWL